MDREFIVKAINADVSLKELKELNKMDNLNGILQEVYGRRKRFLLDKYVEICMKRLNREISYEYFVRWLLFISVLLEDRFYDLSYELRIKCHNEEYSKIKDIEVKELIHRFKDYDIRKRYKYFITYHKKEEMKMIYIKHYEFIGKNYDAFYVAYYVDHKKEKFDIRFISEKEFNYPLDKNICFLDSNEESDSYDDRPLLLDVEEDLHDIISDYKRDKKIDI